MNDNKSLIGLSKDEKEMAKFTTIALVLPSCGGIIFEHGYELQQDIKAKIYGEERRKHYE